MRTRGFDLKKFGQVVTVVLTVAFFSGIFLMIASQTDDSSRSQDGDTTQSESNLGTTSADLGVGTSSEPSPAKIILKKVENALIASFIPPMQWGAFTAEHVEDFETLESEVGKQADLFAVFVGFADGFPLSYGSTIGAKGKTLVIFWETDFGYDEINNGNKDEIIRQFAKDAKRYGYQVILNPFNEMNLAQEAWGYGINGNTAEKFKEAWIRIHDAFVSEGATNVKFALDYNAGSHPDVPGNQYADYYPGDAYVDYIGIDGFNDGHPWLSFAKIFDPAIAELSVYGKPLYILSVASAEGPGKAAWISGMGENIKTYSNIRGFVWFNEDKEENWLLDSDPASLEAFKKITP